MKIAVVTGGSGSIGSRVCAALAERGFSVAIVYNSSGEAAKALSSELSGLYAPCGAFHADVTDPEQVARLFSDVRLTLGRPSVLVNCAGKARIKPFDLFTPDEWRGMIDVNLSGAFFCCQEALKDML
nr:SDR family NAD(P)-dependent oxidoreductase [Clostridia bacterium]